MKRIAISLLIITVIFLTAIITSCNSTALNSPPTTAQTIAKMEKSAATKKAQPETEKKSASAAKKRTEPSTEKATPKPTETASKPTAPTYPKNNLVIVLDAGHDNTAHTRNHPNLGVNEQDLNLKITNAAYKRLNQYNGVTVYRSRPDGTCPIDRYNCSYVNEYPEPCIRARTDFAERKNADLFISLHCNASMGNLGASANGTEVYVSKSPKYYSDSKKLGEIILRNITDSIDVQPRGVLTRSKPEKGTYKDGTVKDFYYLISNNIDNNRPAIIVEHAFMDNLHDNAILKNDANLKKFGIADADAIAEYYGLSLK